jgi:glycosyltransferase involved in cell wall biosynthesis
MNEHILKNRSTNPNKLFEAMMLGAPVISNVCKNITAEENYGLVVDYDFLSLREAILYLKKNQDVRKMMEDNGRRAFERKYNFGTRGAEIDFIISTASAHPIRGKVLEPSCSPQ